MNSLSRSRHLSMGQWTGEQLKQMTRLGIVSTVRQYSGLDRETLAQFIAKRESSCNRVRRGIRSSFD